MVIDLNKCIGCQTCTTACKSLWTDEPGQEYMLWNNVETKPGPGYPRYWEDDGGGFDDQGNLNRDGLMPTKQDHGEEVPLNHDEVYFKGVEVRLQQETPMEKGKGSNWDEDTSSGDYPNNYHFYLPRMCNHCTKPSCLEACPVRAIYKREEDGVVLIDQDKCQGIRECNKACPYDKIYFNYVTGKSQKCIFCFPRLEEGVAPACARQCPGRLRFVGFLEDEDGPINELVYQWKVALPLHPEYGTDPNVFYVPPMLPPNFDENGEFSDEPRVPIEYLRSLFGETVDEAREGIIAKIGENVSVRRLQNVSAENGVLGAYKHGDRIAVLVVLSGKDANLAKDIAMHIAASKPECVSEEQLSNELLEREKAIFIEQAKESGKPDNIIEKMIVGRMKKFVNEVTLYGQAFIKDPETSVGELVKSKNAEVVSFVRFEVGEGMEKKEDNFVEEVMAHTQN